MNMEIEELKETEDGLNHDMAGWYVFDRELTDKTFTDLSWRDSGNGPEPINNGVWGPFATREDADEFVNRLTPCL